MTAENGSLTACRSGKNLMYRQDCRLAKLKSLFAHDFRKYRRESVVGVATFPNGHGEERLPFSDSCVED